MCFKSFHFGGTKASCQTSRQQVIKWSQRFRETSEVFGEVGGRKSGPERQVEYLLSFFNQSPCFSPPPPTLRPPTARSESCSCVCLVGLDATSSFSFSSGLNVGEKVGRKALVGVWVGGVIIPIWGRVGSLSYGNLLSKTTAWRSRR